MKNTRRKTRRGRSRKSKDVTIYYCNVNGFKGKQESILNIVENLQPKIMTFCETKLASGNSIKKLFPQYEIIPRMVKVGQKGMAIGVKKQTFQSIHQIKGYLEDYHSEKAV